MSKRSDKRRKKRIIVWSSVAAVLLMLVIGCGRYLGDYYRADMTVIEGYMTEHPVEKQALSEKVTVYCPEGEEFPVNGLIFYPGGKVEALAYEPLLKALASEGMFCVLVEMPFNLAVLDMDAADGIPAQYPQIENWYIGGHSLGGSMAASYLSKHAEEYDGLVLLGSYSTADLSQSELSVLSVYGSNDLVMNRDKYQEYRSNLPADFCEIVIDGGCHAYFGMYGPQDGDGIPTITNEEQIDLTTQAFISMVTEDDAP